MVDTPQEEGASNLCYKCKVREKAKGQSRCRQCINEQKALVKEVKQEKKVSITEAREAVLELAQLDSNSSGVHYKSEARSYKELGRLFYGLDSEYENAVERSKEDGEKVKAKEDRPIIRPYEAEILGHVRQFGPAERMAVGDENLSWLELRDKARKDLYWLAKEVLGKDLYPHVHQIVCDQFVQKNFDGSFPEGYSLGDVHDAIKRQERLSNYPDVNNPVPTREMMLLDPRGFYKSTLNGVDCVQWLIAVPDVRILILTGDYELALGFMRSIKRYFYLAEGSKPSPFHLLFPEYALFGVEGQSKEPLITPARILKDQIQPSLWCNNVVSGLSGWHCDICKGDDVVNNRNSNTEDTRDHVNFQYDSTSDIIDPWGFADHIGTRYFTTDWYGKRLSPDKETGEIVPIKLFKRQAWTVRPGFEAVPLQRLTAEMVITAFPEKSDFNYLHKLLLKKGETSFRNQQLNEPIDAEGEQGFINPFNEDNLRKHMYPAAAAPQFGSVYITWDWAPTANQKSDWSVGVVARTYRIPGPKEMYGLVILEIIYGKWKFSELALQIVMLAKKWNPTQIVIENSPGAEGLKVELQRTGYRYATALPIYWELPSNQEHAKRNRIQSLEILLNDNRLWFVTGPWIDEMVKQMTGYTGSKDNKGRKDDIPDAMSMLRRFLPIGSISNMDPVELKRTLKEQADKALAKMQYDRYFNNYDTSAPPPRVEVEQAPRSTDPRHGFGIPGLR